MRLKGVFLTLTNKCNLCCKYCYQNSSPNVDTTEELKLQDWKRLLIELKEFKIKKINLVGGEPFLYGDLWNLLKNIDKKIKIRIFTNGLLLGDKEIKKLKKLNIVLSFNLNSFKEKIHDFYQNKGNWKKVVKNIKKSQGIDFEITSPLTKRNYKEIKKFVAFCKELGAKRIRFAPLIINKKMNGEGLSNKEMQNFKKDIKNVKGMEVTLGCKKCEGGSSYLTIQPNGEVTPCSLKKNLILGNIKEESIKDILKKSQKINFKKCN